MDIGRLLQQKIDNKTKPAGALGKLEQLALQIGEIQNTLTPELTNPTMLLFAADHGLVKEGVSKYPKDVTWQMVLNICSGGAAISVFCKQNQVGLKIADVGVDYDFPGNLPIINAKVRRGTRNMLCEPAMSPGECACAMEIGADMVAEEAKNNCNIIGFGEMGIGNTSPSSLLVHKFTGIGIEKCTGAGTGLNNKEVGQKVNLLKQVSEKYKCNSPTEVLATFGGLEIAAMVGAFLEAKKQNMLIIVDGFIASAAALTAFQMDESVKGNCIFCHQSDERGHKLLLGYLGVSPLLDLKMRLGEGSGAAVALPVIRSAVNFLNEMSSFDDAGVSNKDSG